MCSICKYNTPLIYVKYKFLDAELKRVYTVKAHSLQNTFKLSFANFKQASTNLQRVIFYFLIKTSQRSCLNT